MSDGTTMLTFFVLAVFVGFEVVSKVSSVLHTPLMSGANAIHGVILVGAIIVTGHADSTLALVLGLLAVVLATVNMVGGFVVTDRMLEMFGRKPTAEADVGGGPSVNVLSPTLEALGYLVAAVCFILALKGLSSPATARRGNLIGAGGAVLACVVVVPRRGPRPHGADPGGDRGRHRARGPGCAPGRDDPDAAAGGAVQRRRRSGRGAGRRARADRQHRGVAQIAAAAGAFTVLVGAVSFAGSCVTFAKLQELMTTRPVVLPGRSAADGRRVGRSRRRRGRRGRRRARQPVHAVAAGAARRAGARWSGVLFVLPVGGADVPIVISLLNAFTGLAVAASGYVLDNVLLLVAGTLVGASGTILTRMMAAAMGRSTASILFGAFKGGSTAGSTAVSDRPVRSASAEDVAILLGYARKVVIVPGYGLAVAQAQHTIHELADVLEAKGVQVVYGIHPVAGRMPGHMNVLLAEANVPYEQLKEMDEANSELPSTDVALVVGANDVVNPAAEDQPRQPDLRDADPRRGRGARPWSSSSARCGPGSPASRTSCSTSRARHCCSATPRTPSPRCCSPSRPSEGRQLRRAPRTALWAGSRRGRAGSR